MKLKVKFKELEELKKKIKAKDSDWMLDNVTLFDLELYEGKEISSLNEVENYEGLLTYQGRQIMLYIRDSRKSKEEVSDPKEAPKFHVANCKTLDKMREKGRIERYVTTQRTTGKFLIDVTDPHTKKVESNLKVKLYVCKNCLTELKWNGYDPEDPREERHKIRDNFSIPDFFATYSTFFKTIPIHSDITAPSGGYVENWPEIARRYKNRVNWVCKKCGVNLESKKNYLHCHHKNGVANDNHSSNLQALCFLCHAEQPYHNQIRTALKDHPQIEKEINQLREDQGL